MTVNDIMKYIESEYTIINHTPCEICSGDYLVEDIGIVLIDDLPFDVCNCICSKCNHEKAFIFRAPFINDEKISSKSTNLN